MFICFLSFVLHLYRGILQWYPLVVTACHKSYGFHEAHKQISRHYLYTLKLARAKFPANAGNFTCSSKAKGSHTQFTCVTCSLPVKTGEFTCVEAAKTSRRIHAIAVNKAHKLQVTSPA